MSDDSNYEQTLCDMFENSSEAEKLLRRAEYLGKGHGRLSAGQRKMITQLRKAASATRGFNLKRSFHTNVSK